MSKPLVDRIPFAKIVTVLAIVFGVAIGMCGLNLLIAVPLGHVPQSASAVIVALMFIEAGGMLLSALGLFAVGALWLILKIAAGLSPADSGPHDASSPGDEDSHD